ncbi:hypothetical protein QQL38_11080 [Pseudomonas syringae]|uniref:hypothetical protein n=1 Tax=Pseudomonas syringae group TaxID=136849 RepID=UPI000B1326BF|nr:MULTISPECIES: hypothetical protein [Pseudomonas syringae group]MCF9003906.1 hypothetical protein [Pseudomonas syringae]MCL6308865.1 hypothetical protein [Pseudomonas syringae]
MKDRIRVALWQSHTLNYATCQMEKGKQSVMPLPTDNFNKCLAILGLTMIAGSFYFWWPIKVTVDDDYAEVLYLSEKAQQPFNVMVSAVSEATAMINSVGGDRSKLDAVQNAFIDEKLEEATPASEEAKVSLDQVLKPLRIAEVRYKRFILASWLCGAVAFLGLILSCYGFYKWGRADRTSH